MTPQEALAQAIRDAAPNLPRKDLIIVDPATESAAAILDALPEGWFLRHRDDAPDEAEAYKQGKAEGYLNGAQQERERLRKKAGTSRTAANISVFLGWLFAEPEDDYAEGFREPEDDGHIANGLTIYETDR